MTVFDYNAGAGLYPCKTINRRGSLVYKRFDSVAEALRFAIEDMPASLCRAAGEALGAVKGSTLADAVVMASAALRGGGVVYTSDVHDLKRLQRHFPTVVVLPV